MRCSWPFAEGAGLGNLESIVHSRVAKKLEGPDTSMSRKQRDGAEMLSEGTYRGTMDRKEKLKDTKWALIIFTALSSLHGTSAWIRIVVMFFAILLNENEGREEQNWGI